MQLIRTTRENTPTTGSQTTTTTQSNLRVREEPPVVLHLQAVSNPDERRVSWDEKVIDNENMGKKSSKGTLTIMEFDTDWWLVCCIYHRPRQFGESSSDESSSSSSDDSDSENDVPSASRRGDLYHNHDDLPNGGEPCERHAKSKRVEKQKRKPRPNAYERQPHHVKKSDSEKPTKSDSERQN